MNTVFAPEVLFRVASMNVLNNPELFEERISTIIKEAANKGAAVLLLQEVLYDFKPFLLAALKEAGYNHIFCASPSRTKNPFGNVIASRSPFLNTLDFAMTSDPAAVNAAIAVTEYNNREIHLVSYHGCWGSANGNVRLQQVLLLSEHMNRNKAKKESMIGIIGGDFNDLPDSDVIRFMKGLKVIDGHSTTFWTDASVGSEWEHHVTTRPYGEWGVRTATHVGITNPLVVPERQIDFMFSYGWLYGRPGMPTGFTLFGTDLTVNNHETSDHYGMISDFWTPTHLGS